MNNALRSVSVACALGLAAALLPARGITIDFGTSEGYSVSGGTYGSGGLTGQPSSSGATTWTGAGNSANEVFHVVGDSIDGSGQMIQTQSNNGNSEVYTFAPSSSDVGGTFSSTSSIVDFSVQLAFESTPLASGNNLALDRFIIGNGTAPVLQIEMGALGEIDFTDLTSGTNQIVTASGVDSTSATVAKQFSGGSWINISGVINYATDTYTLSVNGIAQSDSAHGINFLFLSNASALSDAVNLRGLNGGNTSWLGTAVDNISITVAPEPAPAGLIGVALLLLGAVGWARRGGFARLCQPSA